VSPLILIAIRSQSFDDGTDTQAAIPERVPGTDHGTHVAGILAADLPEDPDSGRGAQGMSPSSRSMTFGHLDAAGVGDEFAILCALEFIRWLNRDRANPVVHGAICRLRWRMTWTSFACGQTRSARPANHLGRSRYRRGRSRGEYGL